MRVMVVVNPAAGQPEPVLSILNDTLGQAGVDWDVAITHRSGEGLEDARRALDEHYDLVCAYGGDGSVAEVAAALAQKDTPMAILPGGTGNGLADDLGIPADLKSASQLIASGEYDLRTVDVGKIGERLFVLRATMGFEVSVMEAASRELKDRFGWLAYAFASLRTLAQEPPPAVYRIDVDGEAHEERGLACIVANSASTGVMGLKLSDQVDVSDGMLDIVVAQSGDIATLAGAVTDAAKGGEPRNFVRWRGKQIRVEADPSQCVLADGEAAGQTPVEISVLPAALHIVVAKGAASGGAPLR